jgi:hypothetical protein
VLEKNQLEKKSFDEAVNLAIDLLPGLRHDMALIAERRKRQARDMEGTGRVGLNIPDPIDALLRIYHPELYQKDAKLRGAAWLKFMKHPDSARFRINEKL